MSGRTIAALFITLTLAVSPSRPALAMDNAAAALTVSKQALQAYRDKRYKQAALLYRAAWQTHRGELRYLYNAARAAQLAGQLEESQRDFVAYLIKANGDDVAVPKARLHLSEVRAALRSRREVDQAAKSMTKKPAAPPAEPQRVVGWSLFGVGLVAATLGGGALIKAWWDQDALNKKLAVRDPIGKITGIGKAAADAETSRINGQLTVGWVTAGLGLAGVGIGALLLATAPQPERAKVALAPWLMGRGLTLGVRF